MVKFSQIQKPDVEYFSKKRKIYCVANIFVPDDAPDDFKELSNRYWDEVEKQLERIEIAGKVKKIFCEFIYDDSEKELEKIYRTHNKLSMLIKKKIEQGGKLLPIEDKEILEPLTDWLNCLRVVFTREVFNKVFEYYRELSEKRLNKILEIIDSNLEQEEAGLVIMQTEDRARLQFPNDIEVFLITPPSYDDIMRWIRDKNREIRQR
jgi:hypothetical protein